MNNQDPHKRPGPYDGRNIRYGDVSGADHDPEEVVPEAPFQRGDANIRPAPKKDKWAGSQK